MKVGRAVLFTVGALLVTYAAVRVINQAIAKNGGTAFIPDPIGKAVDAIKARAAAPKK